ncbi:MAG: nucleotidyltransferase family protein [Desulfococcaceae bacterium]
MNIKQCLKEKREDILRIAGQHGAYDVRIFGSAARGESDSESDADFLVRFQPGTTLLKYAALVRKLESLLGFKVDIVTEARLRKQMRDQVMKDAVPL